jgi:hypothetical protein
MCVAGFFAVGTAEWKEAASLDIHDAHFPVFVPDQLPQTIPVNVVVLMVGDYNERPTLSFRICVYTSDRQLITNQICLEDWPDPVPIDGPRYMPLTYAIPFVAKYYGAYEFALFVEDEEERDEEPAHHFPIMVLRPPAQ